MDNKTAAPPPAHPAVCVVDMRELQARLDKVADTIAARVEDEDVRLATDRRSLASLLRLALTATVTDIFSYPDRKMVRPLYRGVRDDGNPVTFLLINYRHLIEKTEFFQADLARVDARLLDALRNAAKSKYWDATVAKADEELSNLGGRANEIFGMRVSSATSLSNILPPRKHVAEHLDRIRDPIAKPARPRRRATRRIIGWSNDFADA